MSNFNPRARKERDEIDLKMINDKRQFQSTRP